MAKKLPPNAGDWGSIPGSGRSPGEGHGYSQQYSWLENPMDRGTWWVTAHGVSRARNDLAAKQQQQSIAPVAKLRSVILIT